MAEAPKRLGYGLPSVAGRNARTKSPIFRHWQGRLVDRISPVVSPIGAIGPQNVQVEIDRIMSRSNPSFHQGTANRIGILSRYLEACQVRLESIVEALQRQINVVQQVTHRIQVYGTLEQMSVQQLIELASLLAVEMEKHRYMDKEVEKTQAETADSINDQGVAESQMEAIKLQSRTLVAVKVRLISGINTLGSVVAKTQKLISQAQAQSISLPEVVDRLLEITSSLLIEAESQRSMGQNIKLAKEVVEEAA
ncbi:hypothetical protein MMC20_004678 [Loxospora ochrophaea]|nr:hypothetical protein [Loxospora ochrophaea]